MLRCFVNVILHLHACTQLRLVHVGAVCYKIVIAALTGTASGEYGNFSRNLLSEVDGDLNKRLLHNFMVHCCLLMKTTV